MTRANNIYLVHPKGSPGVILAAFTVEHESQNWAETRGTLHLLARFRMEDSPDPEGTPERTPVPWS